MSGTVHVELLKCYQIVGPGGISVYSHYRVIYFIPCGIIIVHQNTYYCDIGNIES